MLLRVKFTKSYTEMRGVSTYYHHIFLTFLLRSWSKWTTLQLSAKIFYSCRSISLISSAHYTVRKTEQKLLLWVWAHDYLYLKAKHQRFFLKNFTLASIFFTGLVHLIKKIYKRYLAFGGNKISAVDSLKRTFFQILAHFLLTRQVIMAKSIYSSPFYFYTFKN